MNSLTRYLIVLTALTALALCAAPAYAAGTNPYLGYWELTIPGGGAGWLGVTQQNGYLDASILWGGGSVVPVDSVYMDGHSLIVTRGHEVDRKDKSGKVIRKQIFTDTIKANVFGNNLRLLLIHPDPNGKQVMRREFTGKRQPPLPPAPNIASLKFGKPIKLFNGKNLDGWELAEPHATNGWKAENGLLVNDASKRDQGVHYGNLRTKRVFHDFNLKLEVKVPKNGNSGVYLRGMYEVQVEDSYGQPIDPHHMGAIYSRITPLVAAEKPAGEWQTLDITLASRHVTVKLNGKLIINNQPLLGCTGGALSSDVSKPGPILLQGDHTSMTYRNIVLRPIIK